MKFFLLFTLCCIFSVLCFQSGCDSSVPENNKHTIIVYSGGVVVRVFHSNEIPSNQLNSDKWYFKDALTQKKVEVTGTVIVEQE